MTLKTLYKLTSTGKVQTWNIEAYGSDAIAYLKTTYGLLDGKKQVATEVISEGKNLDKANATTALTQAYAEAQQQWEKKVKKGYVQNIEDAEEKKIDTNFITGGVDPMLAHSYDKQGHKIKYPAYMQPKLDGHRCIAIIQEDKCTLWSRTRKPITGVPHIAAQLLEAFGPVAATMPTGAIILDGELYNHDYREKFEELTSFIRQETPKPGHEIVQYWVYDYIVDGLDNAQRMEILSTLAGYRAENGLAYSVQFLDTTEVKDEEEMTAVFGVYVDAGFEGGMMRNVAGLYKGKRSYDLQKVKLMQDAEYEIVDITSGKGKMAGKAMFHCVTPEGKEFRVKMKGALDDLVKYLEHKDEYIHKYLTVQYQKLSAEGVPIFPVGLRIREDV